MQPVLESAGTEEFAAGGAAAAGKPALMVVDDDEGPRRALAFLFKDAYEVILASSGPAALELARSIQIKAAIVDIRMAEMSGIETLEELKKIDPAIEVIMLTGYETLETARQAIRLGACDYLSKPFDIATLREAVSHAMERRAVSDQIQSHHQTLDLLQKEIHSQKLQEEISRTRSEIYASILHDINGPLTVISGFVELVNERMAGVSSLEGPDLMLVRDRLFRVSRQINNCIQISHRYLSFLRGRSGGGANESSVNQVLSDFADLIKSHPGSKGHICEVRLLENEVTARINGTDLMQVLLNLAVNAFQSSATPHSLLISARLLTESLRMADLREGPHDLFLNREKLRNEPPLVAISVADTGPGIPEDVLPRIFDPYFTTKPAGIGTGLGLSIVRRLIEQAEGVIHLHTVAGQGTTFTFYIPAVPPGDSKGG